MLKNLPLRHRFASLALAVSIVGALASVVPQGEAQALATWYGSWDYVLRHDADGQPQAAFARLRGENGALLWLTCQQQVVEAERPPIPFMAVAVAQKQYLGRSDLRGRSTVYWFDAGSPEVGQWIYRDRYGHVPDAEQVQAFVGKMAQARSLTIELSNYRYETQRHEFRLNGDDTRSIADRFRKDCTDILGEAGK